jgi:VanZ family protein
MKKLTPQQRNVLHILVGLFFGFLFSFANLTFFPKLALGMTAVFIIATGWEMNQVYLTQRDSTFDIWDIVRAEVGFIIGLILFDFI